MAGGAGGAAGGAVKVERMGSLTEADSGDWLSEIFEAVDSGAISNLELPDCSLDAAALLMGLEEEGGLGLEELGDGGGAAPEDGEEGEEGEGAGQGSGVKREREEGGGGGGEVVAKQKKSCREKLRREALNDRCVTHLALSLNPRPSQELSSYRPRLRTRPLSVPTSCRPHSRPRPLPHPRSRPSPCLLPPAPLSLLHS